MHVCHFLVVLCYYSIIKMEQKFDICFYRISLCTFVILNEVKDLIQY
jgi:hypothetical protein